MCWEFKNVSYNRVEEDLCLICTYVNSQLAQFDVLLNVGNKLYCREKNKRFYSLAIGGLITSCHFLIFKLSYIGQFFDNVNMSRRIGICFFKNCFLKFIPPLLSIFENGKNIKTTTFNVIIIFNFAIS